MIARIYEVFPLLCPMCGGHMRLIAFVTEGTQIRRILDHIGVDSEPPHLSPARGPPLWDDCDVQTGEGVTQPSQRYGLYLRRFFRVKVPHGREIQGSLGVRSLLLKSILRLVRLNGLSAQLTAPKLPQAPQNVSQSLSLLTVALVLALATGGGSGAGVLRDTGAGLDASAAAPLGTPPSRRSFPFKVAGMGGCARTSVLEKDWRWLTSAPPSLKTATVCTSSCACDLRLPAAAAICSTRAAFCWVV